MKAPIFNQLFLCMAATQQVICHGWALTHPLVPSGGNRAFVVLRGGWQNGERDSLGSDKNETSDCSMAQNYSETTGHSESQTMSNDDESCKGQEKLNESQDIVSSGPIEDCLNNDDELCDIQSSGVIENVEIIPFDSDAGEEMIGDERCDDLGDAHELLPLDDESHNCQNDSTDSLMDTSNNVREYNFQDPTLHTTGSYARQPWHGPSSLSLKERIIQRIQRWEHYDVLHLDDNRIGQNSLIIQMYRRAYEYMEELDTFQRECVRSLSENKTLPLLDRAAPHPKSFLHYIAPKLQAIKLSPEIMLKIRNADADDANGAIRAIAILGCLVDLYNHVLRQLLPYCDSNAMTYENVKSVITQDRRFQQLMECALCGIDINRSLHKHTGMTMEPDLKSAGDNDASERQDFESSTSNKDERSDDDDGEYADCFDLSCCNKWMMGLLSLGINNSISVNSRSERDIVIALAIKSFDLLKTEQFVNRIIDDNTRMASLEDVIDLICVISCIKDAFGINLDFISCYCCDLLGEDLNSFKCKSRDTHSEVQVDEIISKLSSSENSGIQDRNVTSIDRNITAIDHSSNDTLADDKVQEPQLRLIDYMSMNECIRLLKIILKNPCKEVLSSQTTKALVDIVVSRFLKETGDLYQSSTEQNHKKFEVECTDAVFFVASVLNDEDIRLPADKQTQEASQKILLHPVKIPYSSNAKHFENAHEVSLIESGDNSLPDQISADNLGKFGAIEWLAMCLKHVMYQCLAMPVDAETVLLFPDFETTFLNKELSAHNFVNMNKFKPSKCFLDDESQVFPSRGENPRWKEYLYESSVIMQLVSTVGHEFELSTLENILESCLRISEALSAKSLQEMENADILNLISGISSICSKMRLSAALTHRTAFLVTNALKREVESLELSEISRLLESIATVMSTQSCRMLNRLAHEDSVQHLCQHGIAKIHFTPTQNIEDLVNVLWVNAEFNESPSRSSWNQFEVLGQCVAAVLSVLASKNGNDDVIDEERYDVNVENDTLYKICYAATLMDVGVNKLCQAVICLLRSKKETCEQGNLVHKIRFLFALAKSNVAWESENLDFSKTLAKAISGELQAHYERVSLQNFALAIWSIGRFCDEQVYILLKNFPPYNKDELSSLSPDMALRLLSQICTLINAHEFHSHDKVQPMVRQLLSHVDERIDQMSPKELCSGAKVLFKLRKCCLDDESYSMDHIEPYENDPLGDLNKVCVSDRENVENEVEELVIDSLFPELNTREILQMCDQVLQHLVTQSRLIMSSFTAKEMNVMLSIFLNDVKFAKLFDTIKQEIDTRLQSVKEALSKIDCDDVIHHHGQDLNVSYASKIRHLFTSKLQPEANEKTVETIKNEQSNKISNAINLLSPGSKEEVAVDVLLQTANKVGYDFGMCKWKMSRSLKRSVETTCQPGLSYLYP